MSRIVFISPYRDLSELGRQEAAKLGIQVEFYEASMDEAGRVIDTLGEPAVDIFVSRGGTADWIAQLQQRLHPPPPNHHRPARNAPCPCGSGKRFKHCHGRHG